MTRPKPSRAFLVFVAGLIAGALCLWFWISGARWIFGVLTQ